ncbi:MAG TPA: c-type cytochrome, partial [Candidatus Sphingobacterium stercoripullorum]|nr:c-type cytochrome [Candidatus Sphingobacterium stercoripullorum]
MNNGRIGIVLLVLFGFITLIGSCQQGNKVSIKTAQYAVNGQKLYIQHCENCHGSKGEGLGKLYPPLTDSLFFSEYRSALPCIIKNGMNSPIVIHGE